MGKTTTHGQLAKNMKRKKPSSNIEATETVQQTAHFHPDHLIALFNRGWHYMINQRWQEAEVIFAKIEAHHPDYSQNVVSVTDLRYKANYELEAATALEAGNLEAALNAFRRADYFKQAKEVHALLTIQEL